jgi:histidine triad (HIT) family protein
MSDCIFCKIISGQIPSTKIYEDENTLVFKDINPVSPIHYIAIPKIHFASIHEEPSQNKNILEKLFNSISNVVINENLTNSGYRLVINSGKDAGQLVQHLHVHILSGREFGWPPG